MMLEKLSEQRRTLIEDDRTNPGAYHWQER
jgi:hypothetical protein